MKAIIYTSNTGATAAYAKLLGDKTGLPVYALEQAVKQLQSGTEVLYLGWLLAGNVAGYKKAAKRFCIKAVCGVGMGATGSQLEEVRSTNAIPPETPVFTLQGGFDLKKLHGLYKLMMNVMTKKVSKELEEKRDRTVEDELLLDMVRNGKNCVSEENLRAVLAWYGGITD